MRSLALIVAAAALWATAAVADITFVFRDWGDGVPYAPARCTGDHDHDGAVTIDELLRGVSCAERPGDPSALAFQTPECDGYREPVTISQLVSAVSRALTGCE